MKTTQEKGKSPSRCESGSSAVAHWVCGSAQSLLFSFQLHRRRPLSRPGASAVRPGRVISINASGNSPRLPPEYAYSAFLGRVAQARRFDRVVTLGIGDRARAPSDARKSRSLGRWRAAGARSAGRHAFGHGFASRHSAGSGDEKICPLFSAIRPLFMCRGITHGPKKEREGKTGRERERREREREWAAAGKK